MAVVTAAVGGGDPIRPSWRGERRGSVGSLRWGLWGTSAIVGVFVGHRLGSLGIRGILGVFGGLLPSSGSLGLFVSHYWGLCWTLLGSLLAIIGVFGDLCWPLLGSLGIQGILGVFGDLLSSLGSLGFFFGHHWGFWGPSALIGTKMERNPKHFPHTKKG